METAHLLLAMGGVGVVGLLIGIVIGDFDLDLDLGPDWISLPAICALVGAFGFIGAAGIKLGLATPLALMVATVGGLIMAALTVRLARGLIDMNTDPTPRSSDLVGRSGRVVTALTPERSGEVMIRHAGQQMKLSARGDDTFAIGHEVVVVEVLSPTYVRVESKEAFWNHRSPLGPPPADADPPTPDQAEDRGDAATPERSPPQDPAPSP